MSLVEGRSRKPLSLASYDVHGQTSRSDALASWLELGYRRRQVYHAVLDMVTMRR